MKQMSDYSKHNGSHLIVVLFPPAVALVDQQFQLAREFGEISSALGAVGIPAIAPVAEFSDTTSRLQDDTDDLTADGSAVMAAAIWKDLRQR